MNSVSSVDVLPLLENLADEAELEAIMAQPREVIRAELAARGADVQRVLAMQAQPAMVHAPVRRPAVAKVIPIATARPRRTVTVLRSISIAVAASLFGLFVWKEGWVRLVPERAERPELPDSRPVPPPSYMANTDLQKATRLRAMAHKLCDQGYWGECWDRLDEAGRLDRAGNQTLEVNELRNRIGLGMEEDVRGAAPTLAKPSVGPHEGPLRRTPR